MGRGIRLNKKRRKNQSRHYNVRAVKRQKVETSQSDKSDQLLKNYLQSQEACQIQAKTNLALREKHTAPSTRKQMFGILRGQGFYKKFPVESFKKFEEWIKSPSGGQLKCPAEIISEISRFVGHSRISHDYECFEKRLVLYLLVGRASQPATLFVHNTHQQLSLT